LALRKFQESLEALAAPLDGAKVRRAAPYKLRWELELRPLEGLAERPHSLRIGVSLGEDSYETRPPGTTGVSTSTGSLRSSDFAAASRAAAAAFAASFAAAERAPRPESRLNCRIL